MVAYVSNGGYIDANTADGLRKSVIDEFDDVYIYNLRGNQRTAGEQSRREGGKVFGAGSRATIAIAFLVKTGAKQAGEPARLHYRDIGDYLTREQKLETVEHDYLDNVGWTDLTPNTHGDWINQRRDDFGSFTPIGDRRLASLFGTYSYGLNSARSAWAYNSSDRELRRSVERLLLTYESDRRALERDSTVTLTQVPHLIKWSRTLESSARRGTKLHLDLEQIRLAAFRPFQKQHVYFDAALNDQQYSLKRIFPDRLTQNVGFYAVNPGSDKTWSLLMTDLVPDLSLYGSGSGQFFPRYTYEPAVADQLSFDESSDGYRRVDNITDASLREHRAAYGPQVSKDDIFFYVYGLLHSPTYRSEFAADLKKMLPRIPLVRDFDGFAEAGRKLADLHLNYESVKTYSLDEIATGSADDPDLYRVQKMAFGKTGKDKDRSRIIYNSKITVTGIPDEAYRYMLGSRSAVEWIMDRYQVKTDKASGIVNDPNDWATEHDEPRYILDLLKRIVTVSIETMKIVDALPPLDIIDKAPTA